MTAYLGLQDPETVRAISRTSYKRPARECSALTTNGRALDTIEQQPTLPLGERMRWTSIYNSIYNMQTKHARQRFRDMATAPRGMESWYKKHWVPYTATKPQRDEQQFEESFTTWSQLSKYEQDNNTLLPDAVKIAVLVNETKGQAGNITTYAQIRSVVIDYYRATAMFTRLQAITSGSNNQGPAPMDIGATWYSKGKGKKGKGKYNEGKGYGSYGSSCSYKG